MNKLDKIHKSLFDVTDIALSPKEQEIKRRYMDAYTQMLANPWRPNKYFVRYLSDTYDQSDQQSRDDLHAVQIILGNVQNAAKEYQRYTALEMLKIATELLLNEDCTPADTKRAKEIISAAKVLGFVTRLDKEDVERFDWEQIKPIEWEITGDVSVLGLKRIPDLEERAAKLRKELFGDFTAKEKYTDFEEVEE